MTPHDLIVTLETLAEARDGVTCLRELVLQLALRGKLVAQDPADEPANVLLECIAREKTRLIKEGKIPKRANLQPGARNVAPFEVPDTWRWSALAELAWPQAGFAFKSGRFNKLGDGMPLIRIRDIDRDHTEAFFTGDFREEFVVQPGDYLVGMDGNFRVCRWRGPEALLNQRVTRLVFFGNTVHSFVAMALQERLSELEGVKAYTTVQHLSGGQIAASLVPVPPLAEQHRIVARVDELMGLLDRLEAARNAREDTRTALRDSAFAALRDAETPDEMEVAWERIGERMGDLLINPADVESLRQAVLHLAVHGRLVEQSPQEGRSTNWVTVGTLARFQNGYAFESAWYVDDGVRVVRNQNVGHGSLDWRDAKRVGLDHAREFERFALREGDIVLSLDRPLISTGLKIARITEADLPCLLLQRVACPRFKDQSVSPDYFFLWLNSPEFTGAIDPGRSNGVPHISTREVERLSIRLPSLSEQHRTVARVTELMTLLDRLESHLAAKRDAHEAFAAAAVHTLEV